eukprot:8469748-Pyramimonas_sp.AAC.1
MTVMLLVYYCRVGAAVEERVRRIAGGGDDADQPVPAGTGQRHQPIGGRQRGGRGVHTLPQLQAHPHPSALPRRQRPHELLYGAPGSVPGRIAFFVDKVA